MRKVEDRESAFPYLATLITPSLATSTDTGIEMLTGAKPWACFTMTSHHIALHVSLNHFPLLAKLALVD